MSYKQIDKQFEDRFSFLKTVVEKMGNKNIYWYDELKSFLHLIYDQAKAEQREELVRGLEKMKYTFHMVDWGDGIKSKEPIEDETVCCAEAEGYNRAIDKIIATAIRQEGEE